MTFFEYSDTGFTLSISWQWLFLIGLTALFITLARMTAKTHRLKIPQLHEHPAFNLALWGGAMLAVLLAVIALYEFAAILLITDYLGDDTDRHTALRNVGLFLAAVFSAPFLVWRTVIASKQAHTAEQGLYTDRIAKAVEQIGADKVMKRHRRNSKGKLVYGFTNDKVDYSKPIWDEETVPNLEVRIGGLYALERIAGDSPKDHITVMEIICAYIRENCKPQIKEEEPEPDGTGHNLRMWVLHGRQQPRMDISACITIIGRRSQEQKSLEVENEFRLDLRRTDFRLLELELTSFENTLFDHSNFQGAYLYDSNLRNASFRFVNLRVARIATSLLTGIDAGYSEASYAVFVDSDLRNAHLNHVTLKGTTFGKSDARGVYFGATKYDQKTHLGEAQLYGAAFRHVIIGSSGEQYENDFLNLPQSALEMIFGDQSNLLQTDSSGTQLTAPWHWTNEKLEPEEFKLAWRAWQKSIGFDPENPEGSA